MLFILLSCLNCDSEALKLKNTWHLAVFVVMLIQIYGFSFLYMQHTWVISPDQWVGYLGFKHPRMLFLNFLIAGIGYGPEDV